MYTLYYAPGACSLAVHIALNWTGAKYRTVQSNPGDPEYLKINPAAAVPALDIGQADALTQCSAILHYLAARFPTAKLGDDSTQERAADLNRWSAFITGDLHPAFFPVFMPQRYTLSEEEFALEQVRAAGMQLIVRKLQLIDRHLEGREYFMGNRRTLLDAYSLPMVRWASSMFSNGLEDFPDIHRHHLHMLRDEGVKRAMRDEGLPLQ